MNIFFRLVDLLSLGLGERVQDLNPEDVERGDGKHRKAEVQSLPQHGEECHGESGKRDQEVGAHQERQHAPEHSADPA